MSLLTPVQYPAKYYASTDAGAPQLTSADGSIKTIIKACLITGYGDKAAAGWTALFDDAVRVVLRRPVGTGSPPDIKIENGLIGGVAKHRIVSQDSPTGLDDAAELAFVPMVAKNAVGTKAWHLIATDMGFVFCYDHDGTSRSGTNTVVYVGGLRRLRDSTPDVFVANHPVSAQTTGVGAGFSYDFYSSRMMDMRANVLIPGPINKLLLTVAEQLDGAEYIAQPALVGVNHMLPMFFSLGAHTGKLTQLISIDGRAMLRYVPQGYYESSAGSAMYIPLDYWEF